jgi:hypothetical protein
MSRKFGNEIKGLLDGISVFRGLLHRAAHAAASVD